MSYRVEPIEIDRRMVPGRPYAVKVNGEYLRNKKGRMRRFDNSISAALAGTRYVDDVLRPQSDRGTEHG